MRLINSKDSILVAYRCAIWLYDIFGAPLGVRHIRREHISVLPGEAVYLRIHLAGRAVRAIVSESTAVLLDGRILSAYPDAAVVSDAEARRAQRPEMDAASAADVMRSYHRAKGEEAPGDARPEQMGAAGVAMVIALFGGAFALLLGILFI